MSFYKLNHNYSPVADSSGGVEAILWPKLFIAAGVFAAACVLFVVLAYLVVKLKKPDRNHSTSHNDGARHVLLSEDEEAGMTGPCMTDLTLGQRGLEAGMTGPCMTDPTFCQTGDLEAGPSRDGKQMDVLAGPRGEFPER